MAKQIGSITVSLSASTGKLASGLNAAAGLFKGFENSVFKAGLKLQILTTGVKAVAGAISGALRSAIASIKGEFSNLDEIGKLTDRIGIGVDSFLGLQRVAELAGVSQEGLAKSLEKMVKNLGEAADKGGPVADMLEKVGLNAFVLSRSNADDAFFKIADGIASLRNQSERAAVANAVFGRTGIQLLNTLQGGSAPIRQLAADTSAFSESVSRFDLAQIEAFNDEITKIHQIIKTVTQSVAIKLAPTLKVAAEHLQTWVKSLTEGQNTAQFLFDRFVDIGATVANIGTFFQKLWASLKIGALLFVKFVVGKVLDIAMAIRDAFSFAGIELDIQPLGDFYQGLDETLDELREKNKKLFVDESGNARPVFDRSAGDAVRRKANEFQDQANAEEKKAKQKAALDDFKKRIGNAVDAGKQLGKNIGDTFKTVVEKNPVFKAIAAGLEGQKAAATKVEPPAKATERVATDNAALLKGSVEAFSAINKQSQDVIILNRQLDVQKDTKKVMDKVYDILQRQNTRIVSIA